jgi:hypothetical protein
MNTLSIAPQLTMNVLQNMNIKRDTLEKRAIVKGQFQQTTMMLSDDVNTRRSGETAVASPATVTAEYSPSIEAQYLPKSLRGTNPYSIMNAMTENVSPSTQSMDTNVGAVELETNIVAASPTEYISSNEVTLQSPASAADSTTNL